MTASVNKNASLGSQTITITANGSPGRQFSAVLMNPRVSPTSVRECTAMMPAAATIMNPTKSVYMPSE